MSKLLASQYAADVEYNKKRQRSGFPFYIPDIEHKIPPETHELLEKYSGVPQDQHSEHVHRIRDQAFDIFPYPCIGIGAWLVPQLCRIPVYPEILQRVKTGATIMDVGTFIGHNLRRLVYDGAPSDNMYAVDIANHFPLSYDFFWDKQTFKGHFIESDVLATDNAELAKLKGQIDVLVVSQVLHRWVWEVQVQAAQVLTSYTKPGSIIVGNQIGNATAGEIERPNIPKPFWHHDKASWARLWDEVGEATQTRWETTTWLRTFPEMGWPDDDAGATWMAPGYCVMEFCVRRL